MTDLKPLPVSGYTSQSEAKVALVNEFKADEERLLRAIDRLGKATNKAEFGPLDVAAYDPRWLAIARTHFQEGFMALNRAVFQPRRIDLPEDPAPKVDPEDYPAGHPEHADNQPKVA